MRLISKLNYLLIYFDINVFIIYYYYYEFINCTNLIFLLELSNPTKNLKRKTTKILYNTFFYIKSVIFFNIYQYISITCCVNEVFSKCV